MKKRSVLVALLLSIAMPGLGHLYCGRLTMAFAFWPLGLLGWGFFLAGFGLGFLELKAAYPGTLFCILGGWIAAGLHARACIQKAKEGYQMRGYNIWYFYLLVWVLGYGLPNWALWKFTRNSLLTTYYLSSDAMCPTLLPGDWVLVDRRAVALKDLNRGTVVAALDQLRGEKVRILRLVGLAGEVVEVTPQGLSINRTAAPVHELGQETYSRKIPEGGWVDQPVIRAGETLGQATHEVFLEPELDRRPKGRFAVEPGQVLLLGDNRISIGGSNNLETVPTEFLLGRAILVRRSKDPKTDQWRMERRGITIP